MLPFGTIFTQPGKFLFFLFLLSTNLFTFCLYEKTGILTPFVEDIYSRHETVGSNFLKLSALIRHHCITSWILQSLSTSNLGRIVLPWRQCIFFSGSFMHFFCHWFLPVWPLCAWLWLSLYSGWSSLSFYRVFT